MATIKNYKLNPPKKKTDLNRISMLDYVKKNGTKEDKEWFVKVYKECQIVCIHNFDSPTGAFKKGDTYTGYDLPKMRKAFAGRFFPELYKKKEKAKKATTADDILAELEAELQ